MLTQLNQLNTIGGAERINLSIQFLAANKVRVVLTTQVDANAKGELADLLRTPIVLTGSLPDIEIMLTNELFSLSENVTHSTSNVAAHPAPTDDADMTESDAADLIDELDDEDSL
ncbi:hypothetical protein ABHN84_20285 [Shewanella vesiculosa]|uniref:Uncharacterized protein n=1 Tax=Shewanella vesiculosa TaxID=518738 RepID=A0ABV0FUU9_9GAMM